MINTPAQSREPQSPESRQNGLARQVRKFLLLVVLSGAPLAASCASTPIAVEPQSCNTRTKCNLPPDFPEVKLEKLKFLIPNEENYADKTKMPAGLTLEQRPPLWSCDTPDSNQPTSSLTIEAAKQAKSFLEQIDKSHHKRLEQLALLNKIMESMRTTMNSRGNTMRNSDKVLSAIKKVYRDNLRATQHLVPNWDRFLGRITELQTEIDQLVELESEAGKKSEQCAKPQDPLTKQSLRASIPETKAENTGDFEDYKGLLPDVMYQATSPNVMALAPFICANTNVDDPSQIDFQLYQWLDLVEKILGEHMSAALKRETAYVFIQDKEKGVDPNAEIREPNKIVIAQARCIMSKVGKIKAEVLKAIQKDTETAEKLKRCERVE